MKINKLKGFTLIELIVSMAIIGILTTAAIQFFMPANRLYEEVYTEEKTAAITNGTSRYIGETLKFSKYTMIYANYKAPPDTATVLEDIRRIAPNELSTSKISDSDLSKKIQVMYLDNTTPQVYNNKSCKGRIYKIKNLSSTEKRIALTPSYYSDKTLFFSIPKNKDDETKLQITNNTINLNIDLLNPDNTIYSSTKTQIDLINTNSIIQGVVNYKVDSFDNTYIYYVSPAL